MDKGRKPASLARVLHQGVCDIQQYDRCKRAKFLLRFDLGLSHREEAAHPIRSSRYARTTVPLVEAYLASRNEDRRFRAEPSFLFQLRMEPRVRVLGAWRRSHWAIAMRDKIRRRTSAARAQVHSQTVRAFA